MKVTIEKIILNNSPEVAATEINELVEARIEELRKTYTERINFLERQAITQS